MEVLLASLGILLTALGVFVALAQLRRTPKPKREPEPFTPTSLTIIGVPMRRGRDLFRRD
jgi:hypothetical protein